MVRCPSCGEDNREDATFCGECGKALAAEVACAGCGRSNPADRKFCDSCGQRLTESAPTRTPTPQPAPALPASFASGRYQVRRFIGEGGKKRVYLAHDTKLDSDVAIALIKTEGLDAEGVTRIRREAQAMGRLRDHPHIVTVLDIGDESPAAGSGQAPQPYIVQEFMEGGALEDVLHEAEDHRLPLDQAIRIAQQVCEALEHAHGRSVIHRDVKPGNVWLTRDRTVKLGDFGFAVALDRSRLTQEGMMVGTATYMPPEQALGGDVTVRSDLYSLGCLLYEMVAGHPPFLGDDTVAVVSQHINTAPVAPTWHNPEVSQALETLIMRLLAKAPADRPESAASVATELRRIAERPAGEVEAAQPPAPSAGLAAMPWGQFVGRREEMDQLKAALEAALSGRGSLVMLVGEPGIGKTRLAEEFAVYASLRGAQVLTGRSYEGEVALPYRPFVEAFRQYVRSRPDQELRAELGEGAPEVAKIVSEVRRRFPDIAEAPPLEPDAERLRLFESVSAFVCNAAAAHPLVLFLDDIHWADKPSLLMLRYLARATAGDRVLILGAYRDVELDRTHPLSEVIATLRREQPYQRVLLRGLPEGDVLALITAIEPAEEIAAGREDLAAALYQETEGNPFFIREVLSHLAEEGQLYRDGGVWTARGSISDLGIPEGVREVVGKRLSRLSEACNRVLTLVSTMTGGFSWEELQAISGESEAALLDLLDEALAARIIHERKGDHASTYDFTHAIIRQTLCGELSTPRRVVLHRQIGGALEELHADNLETHLAELAHHFYQAAPGGDVDKAIDYATRAGDRAVELLAYEEAAGQYELALQALDLEDNTEERRRCDLLMALGQAYTRADVPEKALATLEQAVKLAEGLREPQLQGRAVVARAWAVGRGPPSRTDVNVPVLERALEALPETDSRLRAELLVFLSLSLDPGSPLEHRRALALEAKEIAERLGDFEALAGALAAMHSTLVGPERTEERVAVAKERVEAAERGGNPAEVLYARFFWITDLAELGEMEEVRREIDITCDLADQTREPFHIGFRPVWGATLATMEGRFEEAERLLLEYLPIAQRTQHGHYLGAVNSQLYSIRWGQGRLGELEQALLQNLEQLPAQHLTQAALANLYLVNGRPDQAREWFERLAANDFSDVPSNYLWMTTMSLSAGVASQLGDRRRAALLYETLRPYAARNMVSGTNWNYSGSGSLVLGQLAATMDHWEDAERHFEDALTFDEKIGARPWLARTQNAYATMLQARGRPEDREKAQELVNQALATFEELGMPKDVERALALKMELQGISTAEAGTSIGAVTAAVQGEQPDLRSHASPDGKVTLFFTDIEGSTVLNERLGDQRWLEVLRKHNGLVRECLEAHDGHEVKTIGDGFMVVFEDASCGLQCAVAIQRAVAEYNETAEEPLRVRIGLHAGKAMEEAGDFYGTQVTLASRIADEAKGGEILVSSPLKELTEAGGDVSFAHEREVELRGFTDPQRVHAVAWA